MIYVFIVEVKGRAVETGGARLDGYTRPWSNCRVNKNMNKTTATTTMATTTKTTAATEHRDKEKLATKVGNVGGGGSE